MMAILGAVVLFVLLLIVTGILIGTREGAPVLNRTRLAGWYALWGTVAAVLTLAAGMRRAGGLGLRKLAARARRLAARVRAGRAAAPAQAPGRHRKAEAVR